MTRRDFMKWSGLLFAAGLLSQLAWTATSFLRSLPGNHMTPADRWIELGLAASFAHGTVTPFPRWRLHLVRLVDGGFLALSSRCTHLGCVVPWVAKAGRFVCPCHASAFDRNGSVLNRPASRPLDLYRVTVDRGVVKVDVAHTTRRDGHRSEHVYYPGRRPG